ncbi:SseB family protein [Starkeya sp. ORNL1]|uniref:SseB family protein n=1 Tax=Starkeya sp. ORNL1 TaxID=2709380 RepID=UPI0014643CC2|nr:SseB family protein [Starkeya sp. ORNL1]QJP13727.1 SseB family protein [Starkeya sp. ORNL1]
MQEEVVVIGGWEDEQSHFIRLQDFIIDGEKVIPIFSDEAEFKRQALGSGFEKQGLIIKLDFLLSFLRGDELFILNPGDPEPLKLTTADLAHAYAHG